MEQIATEISRRQILNAENPLLGMQSAAEVVAKEQSFLESQKIDTTLQIDSLAATLKTFFESAKTARSNVFLTNTKSLDDILLQCERQCKGQYEPQYYNQIKQQGGSTVYVPVTNMKCTQAEAWLRDTLAPTDGKPFSLEPTPIPSLSPQWEELIEQKVQEYIQSFEVLPSEEDIAKFRNIIYDESLRKANEVAANAAKRMEAIIADQLQEGGFKEAFDMFLADLTRYPFACLKAPVLKNIPVLKWSQTASGKWEPIRSMQIKPFVERVSPWNLYCSPNSDQKHIGYIIEVHKMTRMELQSLKNIPGYKASEIDKVLNTFGISGRQEYRNLDTDKDNTDGKSRTNTPSASSDVLIDVMEFHGSVQGKLLKEWGMENVVELQEYPIQAFFCDQYVIKVLISEDEYDRNIYYFCSWKKLPDTLAGLGIPQLIENEQRSINACRRAADNNLALSSGPQVIVNTQFIDAKESFTNIFPWKIWKTKDPNGTGKAPVDFFNIPNNLRELMEYMAVLDRQVDQNTDIPRFEAGNPNVGGAALTAKGLSMLMSASTKIVRDVLGNICNDVLKPIIQRFYEYNMIEGEDDEAKGDLCIKIRDVNSLVQKEMQQQAVFEFMQMALQSPPIMEHLEKKHFIKMLRVVGEKMGLTGDIFPSDEEIELIEKKENEIQQQQAQQEAMVQQQQAELMAAKAGTEKAKADQMNQSQINNAVAQRVISPEEARAAMIQKSDEQAVTNG